MSNASGGAGIEEEWLRRRVDYQRECLEVNGHSSDYVGLARALVKAEAAEGIDDAKSKPIVDLLREGCRRYPRAVEIWEHLLPILGARGPGEEFEEALGTLERLDPSSPALRLVDELRDEQIAEWLQSVSARQRQLLEQASAEASDVSDAALRELRRWARSYPRNSTYTINYALGLLSQSHIDDAASMAQHAMTIEDGSFADAYNIGLVLWLTGRYDEGRAMLTRALARAGSAAERDLAEQFAEENSVWKAQP